MHLFYVPDILENSILSEEESRHAVRVLRLKEGDTIHLVDGLGGFYTARIIEPHPKRCAFEILTKEQREKPHSYRLHIAIAPTKNIDRFEWFLEKCTEIGIDEITPLLCRYSERKQIKPERLEKIIVSAAKQSLKTHFPVLNPIIGFEEFVSTVEAEQKFIAHCYDGQKKHLKELLGPEKEVLILIGPEGDFSREEVDLALTAGFEEISLGNARLRTETAGIVACHTVALGNHKIHE